MELVEKHRRDPRRGPILQDHAGEDALGHDLDPGLAPDPGPRRTRSPIVSPTASPSVAAMRSAAARGQAARFQQDQLAAVDPRLGEEHERYARRLASAGRGDKNGVRADAQLAVSSASTASIGGGVSKARMLVGFPMPSPGTSDALCRSEPVPFEFGHQVHRLTVMDRVHSDGPPPHWRRCRR